MGRGSDRRGRLLFLLLCIIAHDMLADTSLVLLGAGTVSNPLEVHHNDGPATSGLSQGVCAIVVRRRSADEVKSRPLRAARELPSCLTGKITELLPPYQNGRTILPYCYRLISSFSPDENASKPE